MLHHCTPEMLHHIFSVLQAALRLSKLLPLEAYLQVLLTLLLLLRLALALLKLHRYLALWALRMSWFALRALVTLRQQRQRPCCPKISLHHVGVPGVKFPCGGGSGYGPLTQVGSPKSRNFWTAWFRVSGPLPLLPPWASGPLIPHPR